MYKHKYFKYKSKYLHLKQTGGTKLYQLSTDSTLLINQMKNLPLPSIKLNSSKQLVQFITQVKNTVKTEFEDEIKFNKCEQLHDKFILKEVVEHLGENKIKKAVQDRSIYNLMNDTVFELTGGQPDMYHEEFNSFTWMPSDVMFDLAQKTDNKSIDVFCNNNKKLYIPSSLKLSNRLIETVVHLINIIDNLCKNKIIISCKNDKFNMFLALSNNKKMFPKNGPIIFTSDSINSAQATSFSTHLFRKEELFKLVIHELVHYKKIDSKFDSLEENIILENFAIDPVNFFIRWTEVIAECFAQFINIIITSVLINENIDKLFEKEVQFGMVQTAKILYLSNINSFSDFCKRDNLNKIKQSTAVSEYHIFKTYLLLHFDFFLETYNNPSELPKIINMIKTDKQYHTDIDKILNQYKLNGLSESFLDRTGRMSVIEFTVEDQV